MAKVKASELSKMQALLDDLQEKEDLLKMYRKQFDNQCKIYFGKTMKEIEQILSEKSEAKTEQKAEQKTEQKEEPKAEQKSEQKTKQDTDDLDEYSKSFREHFGLDNK